MLRCEHLLCYFSEYAVLLMNTGKLDEAIQKFTSIVKVMKLQWHFTKSDCSKITVKTTKFKTKKKNKKQQREHFSVKLI